MAHFQRAMMMDVDQAAQAMRDEEMNAEIEDFIEGFNQPTYRGMRVNVGAIGARSIAPAMPRLGVWTLARWRTDNVNHFCC